MHQLGLFIFSRYVIITLVNNQNYTNKKCENILFGSVFQLKVIYTILTFNGF